MKLATLNNGTRDGRLILVSPDDHYIECEQWPTLQLALDNWQQAEAELLQTYDLLRANSSDQVLNFSQLMAPLPRAYQWLDGSAYLNHVELVRKARGVTMPPEFLVDPLMYQGGSDTLLGCRDNITAASEDHGIDLEAEVCVITDDTPAACSLKEAGEHIKLIGILNDISLRNLIPAELAKGFGFIQGKPPTAFSPVFVTPDALNNHWQDCKVHLPLRVWINNQWFGHPNCGVDMQFNFAQLVAHAAKTRPLKAGTIIGSGTISNKDATKGFCCLAEIRMIETIAEGKPTTSFLKFGDTVKIDMLDQSGTSVFGSIEQQVMPV